MHHEFSDEGSKSGQLASKYDKYFSLDSVVTFFGRTVKTVTATMKDSTEVYLPYHENQDVYRY